MKNEPIRLHDFHPRRVLVQSHDPRGPRSGIYFLGFVPGAPDREMVPIHLDVHSVEPGKHDTFGATLRFLDPRSAPTLPKSLSTFLFQPSRAKEARNELAVVAGIEFIDEATEDDGFRAMMWILQEIDAEGLLKMGAPADEYRSEARTLLAAVRSGRRVSASYVRDVWLYWFGAGETPDGVVHIHEMPMHAHFEQIAARIHERFPSKDP